MSDIVSIVFHCWHSNITAARRKALYQMKTVSLVAFSVKSIRINRSKNYGFEKMSDQQMMS